MNFKRWMVIQNNEMRKVEILTNAIIVVVKFKINKLGEASAIKYDSESLQCI